ncbi:response regulator [Bdellovibrio bacteriovorus]|uniref:Response regulator n=3 Tax=Bdellovibrio bacteriovorus TaxID=959 RepID=A0A1Z3N7W1_BDEBC|nr:response regulator [Bdellovibrio bacteriovorus]AHZ84708.1 PilL protein [Bdellovibrio bacteriovorus]ASD63573.1 response regulator [Bdellovibrio bacteriovorus]BEV68597.1 Protein-glutamate methylesterase/protein-glutamine glutaminase [Bdellovibrio bacteriovorus]CAE80004.1 putative PilL protein [Bdellovibrio bacteriovorus HD100]
MVLETNLEKQRTPRVLVIDDSLDSVKLMSHILDHYKCDVTMAFDGQDSIPLLANRHFDLVILDWQMPQMGGRDTLLLMDRLLTERKVHKIRRPIPVVIYTGHSEEELDLPLVRNFTYMGFINKRQAFSSMMRSFNFILRSI